MEDKKAPAPAQTGEKPAAPAKPQQQPRKKKGKKGAKDAPDEPELSPEDMRIKEEMELIVQRLVESTGDVQKLALDTLRSELKTGSSSMTSVPKPLKYLRPHYATLAAFFQKSDPTPNKALLADIMSVLAMTMGEEGKRESLLYKLQGDKGDLESWGHDYVRCLAGEVAEEWTRRALDGKPTSELDQLVDGIIPFDMMHNAEPDACDLLIEIGQLDKLLNHVDYATPAKYERVALYLTTCAQLVPPPDDTKMRRVALEIYRRAKLYPSALIWALRVRDVDAVRGLFVQCEDAAVRRQMALMVARAGLPNAESMIQEALAGSAEADDLAALASNARLSSLFGKLAKDLSITEPREPEDIYKSGAGPEAAGQAPAAIDSARQNLAATFVNAFANAGSGSDKLMTPEGSKWVFKNKDHGMMSAAASLGMLLAWDVDSLSQIDKYTNSTEPFIKAGGLLGIGLVGCTVRSDVDPVFALVGEHLDSRDTPVRIGAILALGFAYAGAGRQEIKDLLLPIVEDSANGMEVQSMAALSIGLIFVGAGATEAADVSTALLCALMEAPQASLNSSYTRFLGLALGLLFLGRGEEADAAIETARTLPGNSGRYALLCLQTCAYASTGNVLKVQELLQTCGEHAEDPAVAAAAAAAAAAPAPAAGAAAPANPAAADAPAAPAAAAPAAAAAAAQAAQPSGPSPQGVAVLGIALIACGEDVGDEMVARMMDHLMQYGDPAVRRAVPLGLALLSASNPRIGIMDTLNKLSHDGDTEVALNAILALGFISAGTNNSRVSGLLAQLASYYYKNPEMLVVVRLAQGLLHLGKGTMTLAPFHSDRNVMSNHAMAGLLVALHAALDIKGMILGKSHYLLYSIAVAMYPRMLMTLDENLELIKTPVRVGLAVDVAGQAGRPKAITGFQTHTTPVLLAYGERAELATDEYIPLSPYLEGFVILRKNPNATSSE